MSAQPDPRPPGRTFRIETWGCQMNVLDGQRMAGQLESIGLRRAGAEGEADVVLLNTCSVREKAEEKVFSELGVLGRRKQANPNLVLGVTGCVAQVSSAEILERAPWVDFVAGTGQVERIGELVSDALRDRRRTVAVALPQDDPVYQFRAIRRDSPFQAFVTVIEGCDQFCTFCVVPFTRGRERSRAADEVLSEIAELAGKGFTEVTLLGQTVNAYRDRAEGLGLGELLRRAASVPGIRRVRFLTSHPRFVDDDLIRALASGGAIAPYLHLPAQSGSDRVLYRMKRRYDRAQYTEIVARVRREVPDVAVSSDFIVGFPGETDDDFQATMELVAETRFSNVFAFRYSARPGTASARWGRQTEVPQAVAEDRLARLLSLQAELQREANRSLEGTEFEVLVEGRNRRGQCTGRTPCNRILHFEDPDGVPAGEYVRVRVSRGLPNCLIGERVS